MNKFFSIALVLLAFQVKSQTQVYHSFPDSNAVWNINYFQYCFSIFSTNQYYSITFSGDTIINCRIYHKIIIPYIDNLSNYCGTLSAGYKGAICEDSANKLVIIIPPGSHTEHLLYDFNLKIGDTLKGYLCINENNPNTISSIDSIMVGSDYRKRWIISSFYNIAIIEGIGSTYGLIEPFSSSNMDLPDISITCFNQDGITLYPSNATECGLINSINNLSLKKSIVKLYPNPTDDQIFFDAELEFFPAVIEIYDISGRLEKQTIVFNKNSDIDISDLQKGLYIIKLCNSEISETFKIIKN